MQLIKKIIKFFLWLGLSSLGSIIPRGKKSIVVLAPANGTFTDNSKYAYLWLCEEKDLSVRYITYNQSTSYELIEHGVQSVYYPSWPAIFALLRASVVIGTAIIPFMGIKGHLTCGAQRIQLWHGAGLKRFQLGSEKYQAKNKTLKNRFDWFINRKIPFFDLIYFPSQKIKEVRKDWFRYKEIKINGFVRNDILLGKRFGANQDIFTDHVVINAINAHKEKGLKTILYAPTFRNKGEPLFEKRVYFNFHTANNIINDNDVLFVIKQHPLMNEQLDLKRFERIEEYDKDKDIYPALHLFDILITDHSSIFSDYALLDRPIIHYIPDYKQLLNEHTISSEMAANLPGLVIHEFDHLGNYLDLLLKGQVVYKLPAENLFHDHSTQFSGLQLIEDVRRLAML